MCVIIPIFIYDYLLFRLSNRLRLKFLLFLIFSFLQSSGVSKIDECEKICERLQKFVPGDSLRVSSLKKKKFRGYKNTKIINHIIYDPILGTISYLYRKVKIKNDRSNNKSAFHHIIKCNALHRKSRGQEEGQYIFCASI